MSRRAPVVTAALSIAALSIFFVPGLSGALELDFDALGEGEPWRAVTGHFTHWSLDHLLYDVAGFLVLGAICELQSRRRLVLCLGLGVVVLLPTLSLAAEPIVRYRGLSGLDSALFALATVGIGRQALTDGRRDLFRAAVVFGALFCGKMAFELASGETLFVDGVAEVAAVPGVHVVGALVGGAVGGLVGNHHRTSAAASRRVL